MPRKHKGPPQESIDSILLALSRRDDLGMETLNHYLKRLDEEWTHGAREQVLQLLRSNDTSAHAAAMFILSEVATTFDLNEMEAFVTDPTVSDVAKLTLAPLLKEFGSELADERLVEYLNDPVSAIQQMQMRILELVDQGEVGIQTILNDITELPLDRRIGFVQWLGSSNDARAVRLLIPLLEGQTGKVVAEVIDALEQLGPLTGQQAIPALNHFISTNSNRQLKQQARAVLGRLTMQTVPGSEDIALADTDERPMYEACSSFVDGSGAQLVMLSWQQPDGLLNIFHVFFQDQWGIKDCYGVGDVSEEHWRELIASIQEKSFGCALVPFDYARTLVAEARALNKRTRRKIPIAYYIWRPLIEGEKVAEESEELPPLTILPSHPLDEETRGLAQHGDKLYDLTEFLSWMYEPLARIEPYINRYLVASLTKSFTSHESKSSKRKTRGQQGRQGQQGLSAQPSNTIINEALDELVDNNWRLLYETRLRRQAALFSEVDRMKDANLCMAVAAMLHPDSSVSTQEQPFLQAMMRFSIEQGPMRLMAERMEAMGIDYPPM